MISLREDWVLLTWNDERWLEACFGRFEGLRVIQGPLRVPNCEIRSQDKISYNGMISLWENWALLRWKVIGDMFWSFSGSEGHPRTPEVSQLTTYCDFRSQDKTSYNGIISLWENCVLLVWKVVRGMSDDLRHVLAVFWLWGAPPRVPNVSQLTTQCAMKSRVKISYGRISL